ncbi:DUF502 domain-containing protein [Saccharospirillum impatiens]|uniref:DUF502 domain-containing protein n=1 Tax=Saccharospirillum impatiens TaxID=169438 RepID=UPI00041E6DA9|nr:DUF502 domain-containing protein [Saccharospirillum impatiens]
MRKTMTRGILRVLPLALTVWLFWSIGGGLNSFGLALLSVVGINQPWAGSGFVLILILLLIIGLAFSVSPIAWLYQRLEDQILRFPLLKTVYGAIKDMASLISTDPEKTQQRQTVLIKQANDSYIVGFVTADDVPGPVHRALSEHHDQEGWVPVLMQVSYQIAGVTILVRRSDLIYVDWPFEDAMQFMLTAGLYKSSDTNKAPPPA